MTTMKWWSGMKNNSNLTYFFARDLFEKYYYVQYNTLQYLQKRLEF